jgi:hypothetical protein
LQFIATVLPLHVLRTVSGYLQIAWLFSPAPFSAVFFRHFMRTRWKKDQKMKKKPKDTKNMTFPEPCVLHSVLDNIPFIANSGLWRDKSKPNTAATW